MTSARPCVPRRSRSPGRSGPARPGSAADTPARTAARLPRRSTRGPFPPTAITPPPPPPPRPPPRRPRRGGGGGAPPRPPPADLRKEPAVIDTASGKTKHVITEHNNWVDYGNGSGGLHAYTFCGWLYRGEMEGA